MAGRSGRNSENLTRETQTDHKQAMLRFFFRKFLLMAVSLVLLSNTTTFDVLIRLLVALHVCLRMSFAQLQKIISTHAPEVIRTYQAWYEAALALIKRFAIPVLRSMLIAVEPLLSYWIRESPRFLCKSNTWVADLGAILGLALDGELSVGWMEKWGRIRDDATAFCQLLSI